MSLEDEGKSFAQNLIDVIDTAGLESQLEDIHDAFTSGTYFGAVQGYKRGFNQMLQYAIESLPDIYNMIAESGHDMSRNWPEEYKKLIINKYFDSE